MNVENLQDGNIYLLSKANESIYLRFKYHMWVLRTGITYYFEIIRYIKPKYNNSVSIFGELKLDIDEVDKYVIDLDTTINIIGDVYEY